jgi:hypothetical protein
VGELYALGRPRRTGRVDQAEDVVRGDRAPGGLEVEARVALRLELLEGDDTLGRLAVDDYHVLERRHPIADLEDAG